MFFIFIPFYLFYFLFFLIKKNQHQIVLIYCSYFLSDFSLNVLIEFDLNNKGAYNTTLGTQKVQSDLLLPKLQ